MATIEFWTSEPAIPLQRVPEAAATLEAAGWDGLSMVDSQNLAADPYVYLSLAATGTTTLGLMTGVTNVVTRHPAVTASSAFTVQSLSGGRFVLGIGRGDSALAHIGRSPARVAWFDRYLRTVTSYLNGQPVDMDDLAMDDSIAAPVDQLHAIKTSAVPLAFSRATKASQVPPP